MTRALLEVKNLKKYYPAGSSLWGRNRRWLKAVDDLSFSIATGETLGLVGESGCGKTTAGRTLLRLIEPTEGRIYFDGKDLCRLPATALRKMRRDMQIVFQDPFGSLNPRMTVAQLIGEPLRIHKDLADAASVEARACELLQTVGLDRDHLRRYPHEFSGGQRQRIGIARALASRPRFIVCDEPVSALDVSIQSQIINLLQSLKRKHQLTYLFIAHDLSVVRHISDRIAVMYLGRIVELARSDDLFLRPLHPYTKALLSAVLDPDPDEKQERILLPGDLPDAVELPTGCRFHPRCPYRMPVCEKIDPPFEPRGEGHQVACHLTERPGKP